MEPKATNGNERMISARTPAPKINIQTPVGRAAPSETTPVAFAAVAAAAFAAAEAAADGEDELEMAGAMTPWSGVFDEPD